MPATQRFMDRLFPRLNDIIARFGTPFHIYDEEGIRQTGHQFKQILHEVSQQFFAVKALPDPAILRIMHDMGFGFDCSAPVEVQLAREAGAKPEGIMFTSNNTTAYEYEYAHVRDGGSIINLDDSDFLEKSWFQSDVPDLVCFRINPGNKQTGNVIIGTPMEAKYGIMWEEIVPTYERARHFGAIRFGMHTMVASNDRDAGHMSTTVEYMLEAAEKLKKELGIEVEFINIGGGMGIPYEPDQEPFNVAFFGSELYRLMNLFERRHGFRPKIFTENGRYMTGPHGVFVTRVINRKDIYQTHIGVETAMPALMRHAMYGAYHHVTVLDEYGVPVSVEERRGTEVVNIVGPICENIDRLATQRELPKIRVGDLIVVHDTGAHAAAMGFNYNARTRPQGLLLQTSGEVSMTRRAETAEDLLRLTRDL